MKSEEFVECPHCSNKRAFLYYQLQYGKGNQGSRGYLKGTEKYIKCYACGAIEIIQRAPEEILLSGIKNRKLNKERLELFKHIEASLDLDTISEEILEDIWFELEHHRTNKKRMQSIIKFVLKI
jgi:DNA-directed RNA polymerase subunit RPC12/RpoP